MKRAPWGDWSLKERKWKMFESISVWHRPIEIRKNQRDEFWWRIVKREKGEQTLTERWERNGGRWLVGSNAFLRDAELQPSPSSLFFLDRTCETLARAATIYKGVFFVCVCWGTMLKHCVFELRSTLQRCVVTNPTDFSIFSKWFVTAN